MDLSRIPPDVLVFAAVAASLLAVVQTFRLFWRTFSRRVALQRQRERGAAGELRAEALLRDLGVAILGRQVAVSYDVHVNERPFAVDLRADYLVAFQGRRYVAEVKTGRLAPRIETSATRRQLLEYRIAFDVDGVLLVDAETERVHTVVFPLPSARAVRAAPGEGLGRGLAWLCAGVLAGLLAASARSFFG